MVLRGVRTYLAESSSDYILMAFKEMIKNTSIINQDNTRRKMKGSSWEFSALQNL